MCDVQPADRSFKKIARLKGLKRYLVRRRAHMCTKEVFGTKEISRSEIGCFF
jgi:hypothetical protein